MEQKDKIKIVIADTQFLIIEALKALFAENDRFLVVATIDNIYELRKILEAENAGILITDTFLINYDNCIEIKNIKDSFPDFSILVLTNNLSKKAFSELNKAGVKNILYKSASKEDIFEALEASVKGKKYFCSECLDLMLEMQDKRAAVETGHLTPSEIEIVRLIADGLTTKEIAVRKNISFHTVMTHRKNIFRKLDVNNTSELIKYAMKANIIGDIEYYI